MVTTPSDPAPACTRPDWRADQERRIYEAAGILPGDLSAEAADVVHWLAGWDDHTVRGIEQLLAAARAHGDGYSKVTIACVCPEGDTLAVCRVHGLYDSEGGGRR